MQLSLKSPGVGAAARLPANPLKGGAMLLGLYVAWVVMHAMKWAGKPIW